MQPVEVEICINSKSVTAVKQAVTAVYTGGAARVELCSEMNSDGLTPPPSHIRAARKAFRNRKGLMVMIRPRPGDFNFTREEIDLMMQQIETAAGCGADGVVVGVLRRNDQRIDRTALRELAELSRSLGLDITFHRAFDATPDPFKALEALIECGVARVLTSGTAWGSGGSAADSTDRLSRLINQANGRIEIIIGGGVNPANAGTILMAVPAGNGGVSVHAYSGVLTDGVTSAEAVQLLIRATGS